jgi:hypothetical protein
LPYWEKLGQVVEVTAQRGDAQLGVLPKRMGSKKRAWVRPPKI